MKIVINKCFGGFGLSSRAVNILRLIDPDFDEYDVERNDPELVKVVEYLGDAANRSHSQLKVVEIPDGVEWTIEEYDGNEWVAEKHRTWS